MLAGVGLDELRSDADPIAGLAQTAFEHVAHTKFASNLSYVHRAALVGEARVSRDDEQRGIAALANPFSKSGST